MYRLPPRTLFTIFTSVSISLVFSCVQEEPRIDWSELRPILKRVRLHPSEPLERHKQIIEIEEADSRLYGPIAGHTIFLQAPSPTADSEGLKPRYWLRIEDYPTADLARQRASEYITTGAYERVEKAYRKADRHMLSKLSVREWAIARGKRVYALTTDTSLFTFIQLPRNLEKSISTLPLH